MGTPVVESSTATFQRNPLNLWRLDLGSLLSTTTLSASIASVRATFHTSGVPKCTFLMADDESNCHCVRS